MPVEALTALEVDVGGGLSLLPRGSVSSSDRLGVAAAVLGAGHRSVVIDAGVTARPTWAPQDAVDVVVLRRPAVTTARSPRRSSRRVGCRRGALRSRWCPAAAESPWWCVSTRRPTCPSSVRWWAISPSTPRRRCAWSGDGPTRRRGDWSSPGGPGGSGHGICWGIAFQHPPQQCDRSGFVERIVAVATFRGLHA